LNDGRTGQRLRVGKRFGYVARLQPAAPLDKLTPQKRERCSKAAECNGPNA
jgi:hypothetical protein